MLDEVPAICPYCGEPLTLLVDPSAGAADYIEDCAVCCRPIRVRFAVTGAGELETIEVAAEDD